MRGNCQAVHSVVFFFFRVSSQEELPRQPQTFSRSVGFNLMAFPRLLDGDTTCHEAMLDHFVKVGRWQKDSELDTSKCPCPTPR
jgi:hypothetical protein